MSLLVTPTLVPVVDAMFDWLALETAYTDLGLHEFRGVDGNFPAFDAEKGVLLSSQSPAIVFEPVEVDWEQETPGAVRPVVTGSITIMANTTTADRSAEWIDNAVSVVVGRLLSRSGAQSFGGGPVLGVRIEKGKWTPSFGAGDSGVVRAWLWSATITTKGPRVSTP